MPSRGNLVAQAAVERETTPLLGSQSNNDRLEPCDAASTVSSSSIPSQYSQPTASSSSVSASHALALSLDRQNVLVLCFALVVLIELCEYLQIAPMNQAMEEIICRQLHPGASHLASSSPSPPTSPIHSPSPGNGGGNPCKGPDVQGKLALLRGWQYAFDSVPGLLTAIPYGILSDRLGRRPVTFLCFLGLTISRAWMLLVMYFSDRIPLEWVWLSSAFRMIGGDQGVLSPMLFTMVADVTPTEQISIVFLRLGGANLAGEILASPLSAVLMRRSVWVPMLLGMGIAILAVGVTLVLPETLAAKRLMGIPELERGVAVEDEDEVGEGGNGGKHPSVAKTALKEAQRLGKDVVTFVLANSTIIFLLIPLIFTILGRFVQELTMQYATKRFNWSWSEAAFLLSIRSMWTLALLCVILPAAGSFCMTKFNMEVLTKDLLLCRVLGVFLLIGALLVAFSFTPAMLIMALSVFSIGSGFNFLARSLLNALVEEHFVGTLNAIIGLLEMAGTMGAGPLMAWLLKVGFQWGGAWIGLPYVFAAFLFTIAFAFVMAFRLPQRPML